MTNPFGIPARRLAGALVLLGIAPAMASEDSGSLARLLDSMSSYRADFEQVVSNQFGEILQTATGTMHLARPGRLRWNVDEPYPQLVVADGEHVWIYDPDLEQVTVQPFDETVAGTPAMFLTDTAKLEEHFQVQMETGAGAAIADRRFVLSPRDAGSRSIFRTLTLTFSPDGQLTRLDIVDHLDQETRMAFRHGEADPVLESGLFEFEVPEGVDVIGNLPGDVAADPAP